MLLHKIIGSAAERPINAVYPFVFIDAMHYKHRPVIAFSRNSDYILPEYRIFY